MMVNKKKIIIIIITVIILGIFVMITVKLMGSRSSKRLNAYYKELIGIEVNDSKKKLDEKKKRFEAYIKDSKNELCIHYYEVNNNSILVKFIGGITVVYDFSGDYTDSSI